MQKQAAQRHKAQAPHLLHRRSAQFLAERQLQSAGGNVESRRQMGEPERLGEMGLNPLPRQSNQCTTIDRMARIARARETQIAPVKDLIRQRHKGEARVGIGSPNMVHQIPRHLDQGQLLWPLVKMPPLLGIPAGWLAEQGAGEQDREATQLRACVPEQIVPWQAEHGGARFGHQRRTIDMVCHPTALGEPEHRMIGRLRAREPQGRLPLDRHYGNATDTINL